MEVFIYTAIPIITLVIAMCRAKKGKKSFLLLTIIDWGYVIFNTIALLNALGNDNESIVFLGFKIVAVTIIEYFVSLYMTEKEAEKHKKPNDE